MLLSLPFGMVWNWNGLELEVNLFCCVVKNVGKPTLQIRLFVLLGCSSAVQWKRILHYAIGNGTYNIITTICTDYYICFTELFHLLVS